MPTVPERRQFRLTTKVATPADIGFVCGLAKAHSNEIGFIPEAGIRDYLSHGRCLLAHVDGRPAGYVLGRPSMRYARWCRPITQLVVHPWFRRIGVGTELVTAVEHAAHAAGQLALQAWTRDDLQPALSLWHHLHWQRIGQRLPSTVDRRPLHLWRLRLTATTPPEFFDLPKVAGWKAARIDRLPKGRPS